MRKGVGDILMNIMAIVLIIIALVILIIFQFFIDRQGGIIKADIKSDINFNLLNYLKSPVLINNEEVTNSALINLWYYNKEHEDLLDKETNEIFKRLYGNCFEAYIIDEDGDVIKRFGNIFRDKRYEKSINVALYDRDISFALNPSQYYIIKEKFDVKEVCKIV